MKTIYNRAIKNETNFYMKISEKLVRDTNLTAAAKGVMLIILANNDSFEIYKTNIQKQSNMGKEGFNTVWKELEKYGYINTEKLITRDGAVYQYTINEDPCNSLILTPTGNPTVGFPTVGNPTTNNNQDNNNQYNNDTNGKTNEKAVASSAIDSNPAQDIFNYLVEQNITELDYKDADRWTMNDRDVENINEDIKNHGEDVILEYIDKHIRNHKRNMVTGTSKYDNVSYGAIHNNVKDNRFR